MRASSEGWEPHAWKTGQGIEASYHRAEAASKGLAAVVRPRLIDGCGASGVAGRAGGSQFQVRRVAACLSVENLDGLGVAAEKVAGASIGVSETPLKPSCWRPAHTDSALPTSSRDMA